MGGESDQYGSQGVFAGEEIIVKNGATVTATGGQVNSSYESVGFNAVSWLTVSGENSKVLGYGGTSVKGDSKGIRCDSRFTLTATSSVRAACPAPAPEMWASSSSVS